MNKSTLTEHSDFYKSFSIWIDTFLQDVQEKNDFINKQIIEPKTKSPPTPPPLPSNLYVINNKLLKEADEMNKKLDQNVIEAHKNAVLIKSKKLIVPEELRLKLETLFSNRLENTNFKNPVESDIFVKYNKLENKKNKKQMTQKKSFFNKFICLNI